VKVADPVPDPVPRRYLAVPARTRYLAGTAHVRSLAPWSSGLPREGIWCRVGTRWYPEVPASYPAPFWRLEALSRPTGSRRSGDRPGSRGITCGDGGIERTLGAKAARSTPSTRAALTRAAASRSRVCGAQIITILGFVAQIA
jgi:hypothetical protein